MSKNTLLSELINYVSANASGNVTIAAPSSGYALDVSGTGRYTGQLTLGTTLSLNGGTLAGNNIVSMRANATGGQFRVEKSDGSLSAYPYYVGVDGTALAYYYNTAGVLKVLLHTDGTSYFGNNLSVGYATYSAVTYALDVNGTGRFTGALSGTTATFSGNVGIGNAPNSWSTISALQVINAGFGGLGNGNYSVSNAYYNGTNWVYIASNFATLYQQSSGGGDGAHKWFTASSGTAGNTVSFGDAKLTIANSGAATFSSSLTAGGTGDGDWFTLNRSTVKKFNINLTSDWTTITSTANRLQLNDYTGGGISINGGNVGIGTTAPTNGKLEVQTSATTAGLWVQTGGTSGSYTIADFRTGTNLSAFSIKGNGDLYAANNAAFFFGSSALTYLAGGDSTMSMAVNGSERMRITSGGNVLIGTTSDNGNKFQLNGYQSMLAYSGGGASYGVRFSNNNGAYWEIRNVDLYNKFQFIYQGSVLADINSSNGVYTALSDERKKKDFEDSNIGLAEIMRLKPTLFRMKTDSESIAKQLGFIAQQVQSVIPQACDSVGDFIGVQDRPILAGVVKAIQEQQTQINELKQLINN